MRKQLGALVLGAVIALCTTTAFAQANPSVDEAQRAYADVDYERTRHLAQSALERGGNDRASTGQLYLLWAMASAALDQNDEARTAFSLALAVNPELKLDRSVSPKIRGPYLEARGALSAADGRGPLELELQPRRQALEVQLRDTLGIAASLELSSRAAKGAAYAKRRLAPAAKRRVDLPTSSEVEGFLRVLDRYGNVVAQVGSEDEPERLLLVGSPRPQAMGPQSATDVNRTPYFVTSGALALLGLASGGAATAMYLKREDAAQEWNGPGCERPGMTRQQQCGSVDERRQRSENMAIAFGAAGSALLVGSVVSLLLAPASQPRRESNVALAAGPQGLMLRLGGEL